jgi:catechol 2,3-dioxygenase-like lactoylglutathione lyase family enzyme
MGRLTILENGDVVRSWQDLNMTEIPARLSIITLGAREMDVLRSFYRTLGWPELPNGDSSWTGFLLGGVLLALFPISDLTAEAAPDSTTPTGWSGVTLACTVGTRDEVDSAFAAAVTAGAAPVAAPTDRSWGGRSAFVADPEGNRWEITWSPRATYDARGALLSWG